MKTVEQLLEGIKYSVIPENGDKRNINKITFDSRKVNENDIFFAIKGEKSDGHDYINEVISKGAKTILCEKLPADIITDITYIQVSDSQNAIAIASRNYYDNPSSKLKLVGVTGTNGKTTIATLLYRLFIALGYKTGLLSTIENKINDKTITSTHTTPDVLKINELLNNMVENGCEYCFMEVSSHAIVQQRIEGLTFKGGIFTNLTHDHLDYHKTFSEYLKAKKRFFDNLNKSAFALTNTDDKNGEVMLQNTQASKKSYSLKSASDFKCRRLENSFEGTLLNIDSEEIWSRLVGEFNAYNILAIYATSILLGQDKHEVLKQISNLLPAEGRFDIIKNDSGKNIIIDYAHTPDALINILDTINEINCKSGKIITIIGAGGDRDKTKRPEMAQAAIERSDILILTSDNPRSEKPEEIIEEMKQGIENKIYGHKKILTIENRKEAIKAAIMLANKGDIVLIAGKGHEKHQEINGIKTHFDDKEEAVNALKTGL